MAWYDDSCRQTYVAKYKNEKDAAAEAEEAAKKGWIPQSVTATDGHINVGRTATGAVLTRGIYLLMGGSRSKGEITITYVRSPVWLAEHKGGEIRDLPEQIKIMTFGEEIVYADKPMSNRASLVLTNKRIILFTMHLSVWNGRPKDVEAVDEYSWSNLKRASINRGKIYSDINFEMANGNNICLNNIEENNADKIYEIANRMHEIVSQGYEAKRTEQTPAIRLRHLKEMLDGGLITQSEYDAKKTDLLSRM
jgi:hypothetical protein